MLHGKKANLLHEGRDQIRTPRPELVTEAGCPDEGKRAVRRQRVRSPSGCPTPGAAGNLAGGGSGPDCTLQALPGSLQEQRQAGCAASAQGRSSASLACRPQLAVQQGGMARDAAHVACLAGSRPSVLCRACGRQWPPCAALGWPGPEGTPVRAAVRPGCLRAGEAQALSRRFELG